MQPFTIKELYYTSLKLDRAKYFADNFANPTQSIAIIKIKDLIDKLDVHFSDEINNATEFMYDDSIDFDSMPNVVKLPWLIRIVFDQDKLCKNAITLQKIKELISNNFEDKNKIVAQINIIYSNSEPIMHIRLDIHNASNETLRQFINAFIHSVDLK